MQKVIWSPGRVARDFQLSSLVVGTGAPPHHKGGNMVTDYGAVITRLIDDGDLLEMMPAV